MTIRLSNSIYLHIPKTGGISLSKALKASCPKWEHIGDGKYQAHEVPDGLLDENFWCIIRKPAHFAHSLWHHRSKKRFNWQPNNLEQTCKSSIYNEFMDNVYCNPGIILDYYNTYINSKPKMLVGKLENLFIDVQSILTAYNEPYKAQKLKSILSNKANKGRYSQQVNNNWINKIQDSEKELMDKYYEN